jgi:hypothetical protein
MAVVVKRDYIDGHPAALADRRRHRGVEHVVGAHLEREHLIEVAQRAAGDDQRIVGCLRAQAAQPSELFGQGAAAVHHPGVGPRRLGGRLGIPAADAVAPPFGGQRVRPMQRLLEIVAEHLHPARRRRGRRRAQHRLGDDGNHRRDGGAGNRAVHDGSGVAPPMAPDQGPFEGRRRAIAGRRDAQTIFSPGWVILRIGS